MELIGDSIKVAESRAKFESSKTKLDEHLDEFKAKLLSEESRLEQLEDTRLKLEREIDVLSREINDERLKYKKTIEGLLEEREKLSLKYLEEFDQKYSEVKVEVAKPSSSVTNLIESCKEMVESISHIDFDVTGNADDILEELKAKIVKDHKKTKEEYMTSLKHFLEMKKTQN